MGPVVMIERDGVQSFWEINSADEPDLRNWCMARGRSLDPESLRPTQAAPGLDYPKGTDIETNKEEEEPEEVQKPKTAVQSNDPFSMDSK